MWSRAYSGYQNKSKTKQLIAQNRIEHLGFLLGEEGMFQVTYSSRIDGDGTIHGECSNSGVFMTGEGIDTFRATGAGAFNEDGGTKFRGAVYFRPQPLL